MMVTKEINSSWPLVAHGLTESKSALTWVESLRNGLARPVDSYSLAVFRILLGLVMFYAMVRFLVRGWVKTLYLDPTFHFPWVPFIQPWPGIGMYIHLVVLAVCALGIALGCFYRISIIVFFVGFTYLEFLDRTAYLNHYYLVCLLSGLMMFIPAHCQWSVDAWRKPVLCRQWVPSWTIFLLRFQLVIVYVFAGLAKLNRDWLFAAQPMRMWLMARSDLPLIGPWLAQPWAAISASWLGAAHDLFIPFLLLFARTRLCAYLALVIFHVTTAILFPIGMFPWIMLTATTIFFPPTWPRDLMGKKQVRFAEWHKTSPAVHLSRIPNLAMFAIVLYCILQVLIPLRAWFYPQQGSWDVRGFNFAWRVMLVEKTGDAEFYAFDPATKSSESISLSKYITTRQEMMMAQDPHLIRALAQFLGQQFQGREIRVDGFATLNGRPSQRIVKNDANLAAPSISDWIVPLK